MHHYRQALLRMRQGDSDRDIAAARLMGRPKAAQWRRIATERGWLDAALPLLRSANLASSVHEPCERCFPVTIHACAHAQCGASDARASSTAEAGFFFAPCPLG